jgi:putative membrane protein
MAYHYLWLDTPMLHGPIHLLVNWLLSALALWLVARIIPGIQVRGFGAAMIATLVLAVVDFFIGSILRFLSLPFIWLTLGLFTLVIKAFLLKLTAMFTPGFRIQGFLPAFLGAVVLTVITFFLRLVVFA